MIIYIFEMFFILSSGYLLKSKRITKKAFLIISYFSMALILGLRGSSVGEDTLNYINVFEKTKYISWRTIFTSGTDVVYATVWNYERKMEVGYIVLNKLIRTFTYNPQWLLIIVAFVTYFLMGKFIYDNCNNVFLPTYIILCESFYMQSFNLMRQSLSIAIGLQAYTILKNNRKRALFKAIITIFIACLFHKSAVALLAIIPLTLMNSSQRNFRILIILSFISPMFIPAIRNIVASLVPRYVGYFDNNYWEVKIGGILALWIIEIIIIIYTFFKYKIEDGKEIFISVSCVALYLALEIIGLRISVFNRVSLYFRVFLIFFLPNFSTYMKPKSKFIYTTSLVILLSLLFLSYASETSRLYNFYWN